MSKQSRPTYGKRQKTRARLKAIGAPCAICGKPIDYDLDWWYDPVDGKRKRHPLSFEYDHRTPLARGGSNGFDNAQPAHRICNQRKGARRGTGTASGPEPPRPGGVGSLPTSRAW